ncbi:MULTISPECIES: nucleoside deaminase [Sphingobacterium]|uniref:tRNA-specific adenosine deaminase n=1 Tax=Sphingobacterium populi TaxID=1812824 RepID=A0ABW5UAY0_9SPHI|nr:nucleoside deaminase [Sphingobacterium sp. CFCC 11742]
MKYFSAEGDTSESVDELFMREALRLAKIAYEADEIPIGAVIVANGQVIAKGYNLTERLHDVTAHAEMQAFTAAANHLGGKYLKGCTLYVTIEPCVMCAGAAYWVQVDRIVYGAKDDKRGYSAFHDRIIHPKTEIKGGVLETDCSDLIQSFFRNKRN